MFYLPFRYYAMSTSCVLRVTSTYSLDAGGRSPVTCTVYAEDEGDHTATASLIITIGLTIIYVFV